MQNQADKRREKLQEMRLRFRQYQPQSLREFVAEQPPIGPKANESLETVEVVTRAIESESKQEQPIELDITNLAPRRPNWDLKRDLALKLERLDHKTQIAVAEIIRDRLHRERNIGQIGGMESFSVSNQFED